MTNIRDMTFGIATLPLIPVRSEPSHKSEMTTQVLFGECFQIIDSTHEWALVHTSFDHYEGWIPTSQMTILDEDVWMIFSKSFGVVSDKIPSIAKGKISFNIPAGSSLPAINRNILQINEDEFQYTGHFLSSGQQKDKKTIIDHAMQFLNAPYLWGGRTHFGIDCSGLVQIVYKMSGYFLDRDSSQQAFQGEVIGLLSEAEPGDLAFFDDEDENITHVGILIPGGKIIHASDKVRIDKIDHHGIYNTERQEYSHKLRLIKKILG